MKHSLTLMSRGNDQHLNLVATYGANARPGPSELHTLFASLVSVLTTNNCKLLVKSAVTAHVLNRARQKVG